MRAARLSRRLIATFAAAAGMAGLTACGGSSGFTIDHSIVQTAIEVGIAQQQHTLAIVSCPPGIKAHKGGRFVCTVTFRNGSQSAVTVTELDDHGNVHYAGLRGYVNGRLSGG